MREFIRRAPYGLLEIILKFDSKDTPEEEAHKLLRMAVDKFEGSDGNGSLVNFLISVAERTRYSSSKELAKTAEIVITRNLLCKISPKEFLKKEDGPETIARLIEYYAIHPTIGSYGRDDHDLQCVHNFLQSLLPEKEGDRELVETFRLVQALVNTQFYALIEKRNLVGAIKFLHERLEISTKLMWHGWIGLAQHGEHHVGDCENEYISDFKTLVIECGEMLDNHPLLQAPRTLLFLLSILHARTMNS